MVNRLDIAILKNSQSIDFVIDGVPMSRLVNGEDWIGLFMHHRHASFGDGVLNREQKAGFSDIGDVPKRLNFYSTCFCGDPWCGAVACDVSKSGDKVVWSAFAYECGYVPERDAIETLGPFEFDAGQYDDVIERAARGDA
jgi:hypothetical protein